MGKKKTTLKIAGIALSSTLFLAGCGAQKSSAPASSNSGSTAGSSTTTTATSSTTTTATSSTASDKPVNLTFWNSHPSGALKTQIHTEVSEFEKTHPNIHITVTDKYSDVQPVTAAFAANKAPNIAMVGLSAAEQFAKSNYLVDLTPYMNSSTDGMSQSDINQAYYPSVWKTGQISQGKQYLLPFEENAHMEIFYNKDLLAKVGITQAPKTWQDIQTAAQKITALGNGYHGIAWTPSDEQFLVLTKDFGGKIFTDSTDSAFDFNNAGAKQAFTMLRNMVANKSMDITKDYNYQLEFGTGKIGMLIDSSAGYTYDKKSVGGKFTMVATPAPAGPNGQAYNYMDGDEFSIFNTGSDAQKQAAWTFIKWMTSPKMNAEWSKTTNYVPVGPASTSQLSSFYKGNPDFAAALSDPNNWITIPATHATEFESALTNMMSDFQKGLLGQESVDQALKNMTTVGNQYMSGQKK